MKRNSFIATLLGLVFPEFAYLWLGAGRMAIFLLLFEAALLIFGIYLGSLYIGVVALAVSGFTAIAIHIFVAVDTFRRSRTPIVLSWYNKLHYYVLFVVGIIIVQQVLTTSFRANFVEFFRFPGGVLTPTVLPGDYVAIDKMVYRNHPVQRGDIVTMRHPDGDPGVFMFRVIGLPEEEIKLQSAKIFINGTELSEPYAYWKEGGLPEGEFEVVKVPSGHYLVLGDNRDHSRDSRFWNHPFVPVENIEGKAIYIYWSWNGFQRIGMHI